MNNQTRYILFDNSHHGWLQVPISELVELDILEEMSPFSYRDKEFAYLEEDMDMGTFIMERQAKGKPFDWESEIERRDVDIFPHLPSIHSI